MRVDDVAGSVCGALLWLTRRSGGTMRRILNVRRATQQGRSTPRTVCSQCTSVPVHTQVSVTPPRQSI